MEMAWGMHVITVSTRPTMRKVAAIVTISWTPMETEWEMPVRERANMSPMIGTVMGIWMVLIIANM